ncbi:MAG: methyltransferase domain-containing protein [Anaerolineales bacterium]|nr:methyltransferase domain-containing protein [Anaerolineales bacterium]
MPEPVVPGRAAGRVRRSVFWLVRIALGLLYTQFAWAYDLVAWLVSFGRWSDWQQTGLLVLPPGPVLELGHGPGHLLWRRLSQGQPSVGVDRSRQMGRIALRRLRRDRLPANVARAMAQALPFAGESFQAVLATFPTEYILDPLTLDEVRRVLRPGGILVIIAGVRIAPKSLPDRFLQGLYQLTGETPALPATWAQPFEAQGFRLQTEPVAAPAAEVLRIVATKP